MNKYCLYNLIEVNFFDMSNDILIFEL